MTGKPTVTPIAWLVRSSRSVPSVQYYLLLKDLDGEGRGRARGGTEGDERR